eukprot:1154872-Pelagomonas_calceolata.AAC.6
MGVCACGCVRVCVCVRAPSLPADLCRLGQFELNALKPSGQCCRSSALVAARHAKPVCFTRVKASVQWVGSTGMILAQELVVTRVLQIFRSRGPL